MLIPEFWAEARVRHRGTDARGRNRQWTVRRFGWSQFSQADAEAMAQQRADAALQRIMAGESLPRREAKVPYNSADGLPIREEVLERLEHGAVVTRNSYGAHCLNTPDVLFADLDFEPDLRAGAIIALIMVTVIVLGLTIWRFGALHAVGVTLVSFMLFGVLAWRRQRTQSAHRERWFAEAQRRVEASAQADPQALLDDTWYRLQPLGTEGQGTSARPDSEPYKVDQLAIPFGAGLKFNFGRIDMQVEWGLRRTYTDYIDDVSGTYVDNDLLAFENGPLAALLADPSGIEAIGLSNTGHARGDVNTRDWYQYTGLSITYIISRFSDCDEQYNWMRRKH